MILPIDSPGPASIAARFVAARRSGMALPDFPGVIPASLADAYRVQEAAIRLWPAAIVGWKVGGIAPERRETDGEARLVGPIFAGSVRQARPGRSLDFPVFAGGFAAIEAELVFRIGRDAPDGKTEWTAHEALAFADALHFGVETAGSPLATINELGPRVVVSDFGNNAGLLLGDAIADWRDDAFTPLTCISRIEGFEVGRGTVDVLGGAPAIALAFALSRCARNGRPLRAGDLVTTGAITGIHDIVSGQQASVAFGALGEIHCHAVDAPRSEAAP